MLKPAEAHDLGLACIGEDMFDLIYLALGAGVFVLLAGYAFLLKKA